MRLPAVALPVSLVTDASGDVTAYTPAFYGKIATIRYVKDGTTPFDNGVDFTLTNETTGEVIWDEDDVNASATRAPRQATHDTVGAASLYAAAGEPVEDKIVVGGHRVKIVVAQGGNVKTGVVYIIVEDYQKRIV